ncbi:MAG TPA: LysR substrate-binding domain-containing protein [Opitutaceae bacterium]|nr:LysR substrate-binding domain-containing protein [Opitutaceae bacterium]
MELRHLRSFLVAAELEHFGRAAQRLHIVQPALSRQIRELEAELRVALFERLPRGVCLTAAGRAFGDDARILLADADRAAEHARQVAAGLVGALAVGFVDTAVHAPALPRLLDAFRRTHPTVRLALREQTSLEQAELLRRGALDIGFVYHRPAPPPRFGHHRLLTERIVLAVPAKHRLARRRSIRLAELREEAFVWIPESLSPAYSDLVYRACAASGFRPRVVQEGDSEGALLAMVAAGAGLTFCLRSARYRLPPEVVLVALPEMTTPVHLGAVWREDNTNPTLPSFLEQLRAKFPDSGSPSH